MLRVVGDAETQEGEELPVLQEPQPGLEERHTICLSVCLMSGGYVQVLRPFTGFLKKNLEHSAKAGMYEAT